jgi:O-antigen/teichoic acid export membrane protein
MTVEKLHNNHINKASVEFINLYKNIGWGVLSSILQSFLYSIFFIVVARQYSTKDFSNYIISNNLYGFILSFASLGLGQWFLREIQNVDDKDIFRYKFLKTQLIIGITFYAINLILCKLIYDDSIIFKLSLILGINIILDNIINVFKFINIDSGSQHKTFIFLSLEAIVKFFLALLLLVFNFNILLLSALIVAVKLMSLVTFFKYGLKSKLNLSDCIRSEFKIHEINKLVQNNISFAIIGGISVLFWGLGNIIVSKFLTIYDVANYDIIFKIFGMAQIIPVIFSATVFTQLVKAAMKDKNDVKKIIKNYYYIYFIYGVSTVIFICSYADNIIPLLFGSKYVIAISYCKEMFLTMIVFPVVLLQANLLIAIKKEKIDMWINLIILIINLLVSIIGVIYYKNLSVINYSIFISFLIFMIMQDIYLVKIKMQELNHIVKRYVILIISALSFGVASIYINRLFIFPLYGFMLIIITLIIYRNRMNLKIASFIPKRFHSNKIIYK